MTGAQFGRERGRTDEALVALALKEYGRRARSQVPGDVRRSAVVRRGRDTFVMVCAADGSPLMPYECVPNQASAAGAVRMVPRPDLCRDRSNFTGA